MLRAVWMDDRPVFDKSWHFTKTNLQRPDHLFSWKYGSLGGDKYGVLVDQGGQNSAADADSDIALALLMAYSRWNEPGYLQDAQKLITAIWKEEVVTVNRKPVMAADNLEKNNPNSIIINPSYFSPAAYKIFAKIDPLHDWNGLAANSYSLLEQLSDIPLDKRSSGLPPDWAEMNRASGSLQAPANGALDTNFGYDAFRVPFRLALDYEWNKDDRAKQVLSRFGFLQKQWDETHKLKAVYSRDGVVVSNYESPAAYGAMIGYFKVIKPSAAHDIYESKLKVLYDPDNQSWQDPAPGYYEDNWAWFGLALMQGALPNLTADAS
jgi:endoglucanase